MKYKKILIVLITCLLIVSSALVTYIILSKENVIESNINEDKPHQNINIRVNTVSENVNNTNNEIIEEKNTEGTDIAKATEELNKNEVYEKSHIEEQDSDGEISKQDEEQIALGLVKDEWGEDDSVYYTIDRHVGNIYDISVRSKSNTQSLMEYKVDTNKKTVEMK